MKTELDALVEGRHNNPFAVLGLHTSGRGRVVRTYQPGAKSVDLVLSLIHISEPTRLDLASRMPSSA